MADLAFLSTAPDSALLSDAVSATGKGANLPGKTLFDGQAGQPPGAFAGLFKERLQVAIAETSSSSTHISANNPALSAGQDAPLSGNGLPGLTPEILQSLATSLTPEEFAAWLEEAGLSENDNLSALLQESGIDVVLPVNTGQPVGMPQGLNALPVGNTMGFSSNPGQGQLNQVVAVENAFAQRPSEPLAAGSLSLTVPTGSADGQTRLAEGLETRLPQAGLLGTTISASARLALERAGIAMQQPVQEKTTTGNFALAREMLSLLGQNPEQAMTQTMENKALAASLFQDKLTQVSQGMVATDKMVTDELTATNLAAVAPRTTTSTGTGIPPTVNVATPVGQQGWSHEMAQRVTWLARAELREAQLQLHPRSLGPVEVRIAFGPEQQLHVSFSAVNPLAREALDSALPRLREMFEQQGLNLADANVSQESFAEQQRRHDSSAEQTGGYAVATSNAVEPGYAASENDPEHSPIHLGQGMLDAYA